MNWFFSIIRIAGASFPVASSFVQLQSEIDSNAMKERINKLSDPISYLHDDVQELSKLIYSELKISDSRNLHFDETIYKKYSRALAVLESNKYIKGYHTNDKSYAADIYLPDPTYIMYLCALAEDSETMEKLVSVVDSCEIGKWLNGKEIKTEIGLPLEVIKAVFEIYESRGYGLCSKTVGAARYMGKA
jgi:hypothetical protein